MCTASLQPHSLVSSNSDVGVDKATFKSAPEFEYNTASLKLAIQINMGDHAFIQHSSRRCIEDDITTGTPLPLRDLSTSPSTTVTCNTPDPAAIYSSAASFSYPLTYDSSLPTPVSVAGSPSLSDRASVKMAHSYSNTGGAPQQPTPPGTARPSTSDWFNTNSNHHPVMHATQSSSPMAMNPGTDILVMHGLDSSSPTPQNIPVTTAEYWGHYGVSSTDPRDELSPPMSSAAMFSTMSHVNPSNLLKNYQLAPNPTMALAPTPQVPVLNSSSHPGALAPMTPVEGINPFGIGSAPLMIGIQPSYKRNAKGMNNRRIQAKRRQRVARGRRASRTSLGDYEDDDNRSQAGSESPRRHVNQKDGPRKTLKLRPDDKKPEDIFLFELREELIELKGRGMWDKIVERYAQRYEKKERAALQMQLSRAILRLACWPDEEDRALLEALKEYDRRRYIDILKIMREKGGCAYWDWKAEHIAKRLAELGEEEFDPEVKPKKIRRRRKEILRQREQPNLWNKPSPPGAIYDDNGFSMSTRVNLTAEQEEQLFENMFVPEPESSEADDMDISESTAGSRRVSTQQEYCHVPSERVAKQVCQRMITQQHGNVSYYGNHYSPSENHQHMS